MAKECGSNSTVYRSNELGQRKSQNPHPRDRRVRHPTLKMRCRLPQLALSKPLGNGNESKDSRNHNGEGNHADSAKFQPHVMGAVGHRTRVLTDLRVCETAAIESLYIIWIDPQRLIVVLNRAVEVALVAVGSAPAVERFGIVWIQLQCLIVVLK